MDSDRLERRLTKVRRPSRPRRVLLECESLETRALLSGVPTIGSFTDGAASVTPGGFVSLYAKNVAENGTGAIAGVRFYRESDGTSGLQAVGDAYVGLGIFDGNEWTFNAPSTGLSGTQTYYAVAYDTAGGASTPLSVTASITAAGFANWTTLAPILAKAPLSIGSIASTSVINFGTTVYTGLLDTTITLDRIRGDNGPNRTGDGASFTNNGDPPLPTNRGSFFEFTIDPQTGSVPNFATSQVAFPGPMRFMIDTSGDIYFTGDHYSTDVNLYVAGNPTLGSVAASPSSTQAGTTVTLTAVNVGETISPAPNINATVGSNVSATVSNVMFFLDTNGTTGLQTDTDRLLGSGTQNGSSWTLSGVSTTGLSAGTYTVYALAFDRAGNTVTQTTTLTIAASGAAPTIGSFAVSPTSVTIGSTVGLTASNVAESGGAIAGVNFYRESNGTSGLQIGADTLVGTGTQSGTSWTLDNVATTGLAAGIYDFYAVATDSLGVTSTVSSTTLTITNPATNGVLLAWDVNGQTAFGTQGYAAGTVASGVTNSLGLTRCNGVTTTPSAAANAWGGNGWAATSAAGISGNQFVTFGLTVAAGEIASLASVDLFYRRSASGSSDGFWQFQINGGSWTDIGDFPSEFSSASSSGAAMTELNLSGVAGLQNLVPGTAVVLRLVPYGATTTGGNWYVYDETGNDLVVNGSVAAAAPNLVYVSNTNFGLTSAPVVGQTVDGDSGTVDTQAAVFGFDAFASISSALSAVTSGGSIVLNSGTYAESTNLTNGLTLALSGGPVTLNAIDSAVGATINLQQGNQLTTGVATGRDTIAGVITGSGGLTKVGSDALVLTGAETYQGGTTVSAGSLVVDGSLSATTTASVASTGILAGTGTISGSISSAGLVSPGDTAGATSTLSVGNLILGSGSLNIDLTSTAAYDDVASSGAVNIVGASLNLSTALDNIHDNDSFAILTGTSITGSFSGGSTVTVGSRQFSITYNPTSVVLTALAGTVPTVLNTTLNGGLAYIASALAANQHSMVENIVYSFSSAVSLSTSNFSLTGINGTPSAPNVSLTSSGGGTVWTVTFSGVGVNNGTHSIGDGEYQLVLNGVPGLASNTYDFFRLLGDMDGDGAVSAADFSTLISTFLRPTTDPLYLGADDLDGDGTIGASDLSQFTANFLHTVPTPLPN